MSRRGTSLIQVLAAVVIMSVLSAGVFQAVVNLVKEREFSAKNPTIQEDARQMANLLAGAFRRSSLCTSSDSGCTLNSAVSSFSASGVTIYTRPSSTLVQTAYGITNGSFTKTVGGTSTTLYTDASLNITYYSSNSYNATSMTATAPGSLSGPNLVAVKIQATITRSGFVGTYSTIVRLRNSPKRL
ncbi:MAG: hypothetical protein JST12_13055 [Armatimonadetes bacterium]|nr:hypothetical protein [Armatimonadota bacterium]